MLIDAPSVDVGLGAVLRARLSGFSGFLRANGFGVGGADANGRGLSGLAARASAIGGTVHVTSPAGGGTAVAVSLPL